MLTPDCFEGGNCCRMLPSDYVPTDGCTSLTRLRVGCSAGRVEWVSSLWQADGCSFIGSVSNILKPKHGQRHAKRRLERESGGEEAGETLVWLIESEFIDYRLDILEWWQNETASRISFKRQRKW
jgi:hypothetical protein